MENAEDTDITGELSSSQGSANGSAEVNAVPGAEAAEPDLLEAAKETAKEWERKFLYLSAEFDNFRKRMQKERFDHLKWGHEDFLRDQLQVLDNFERAIQHAKSFAPEKQTPFGQMLTGTELVQQQFAESLKGQGVVELNAIGQKFDPLLHEAVAQEVTESAEPHTVIKELQKGYLLHGRLLRPARVVTAKGAEE